MRSIVRMTLMAAVTGAMLAALPACGGRGNSSTPEALIPAAVWPIADVPIPAGFRMTDNSRAYLVPNTQLRFVDHHYKGGDGYLSVARFFRDQLPGKGWTLISQQQAGETVTLNFNKGPEDLVVVVRDGTMHTHVQARLNPAARNTSR